MKKSPSLLLSLCLAAVSALVIACESEKSHVHDTLLDVSPSYTKANQGKRITLTARGGENYVWSLSNSAIGSLSSVHGPTVVYTAQVCGDTDETQTITVQGTLADIAGGTNTLTTATGTATVLHLGRQSKPVQTSLNISPSYTKLAKGEKVTLKATGGKKYTWKIADSQKGSLSSTTGDTVVYTAQLCDNAADFFQTITVTSDIDDGTGHGTTTTATGTATIMHFKNP